MHSSYVNTGTKPSTLLCLNILTLVHTGHVMKRAYMYLKTCVAQTYKILSL